MIEASAYDLALHTLALALFWASVASIAYAYLGFPLLVALRAWLAPAAPPTTAAPTCRVSVIIAAHNEEREIGRKLENLLALDYPEECVEVIVASDGSDDRTVEIVRARAETDRRIRLLDLPRGGKNRALNRALEQATGEIVVFSDCDTMLEPDCLRHLLAPFADPQVGGVGGDFHYVTSAEALQSTPNGASAPGAPSRAKGRDEGEGERLYWSYDRLWKSLEARGGSMTSATGQIYAIRRSLVSVVPDGVTDDFFQSTGVIAAGYRLWFCPQAIGRGLVADSAGVEFRRKVRVTARGLASVWERRRLLDPTRHGFYALQLWSHKVLRRLVGVPLIALFASAAWLGFAPQAASGAAGFFAFAFAAQFAFHAAAGLGWIVRDRTLPGGRLLRIPLYFDLVNVAALVAACELLAGKRYLVWSPERPPVEHGAA